MSRNAFMFRGVIEIEEKITVSPPPNIAAQVLRGRVVNNSLHGVRCPVMVNNFSTYVKQDD